jgi:hypothetical protein
MIAEDVWGMIELLKEAETGAAALYRSCARAFPEDAELWNRLMREELQHAEYIERAGELIESDPESCRADREFNARAVREFIRGTREARQAVETGSMGRRQALQIAYEMEESYIEREFAGALFCDSPALVQLHKGIVKETMAHRHLLRDALDAELCRRLDHGRGGNGPR